MYYIFQVKCEKIVIENDDIANGITELILLHGVSKLVMGAAADKQYSRCVFISATDLYFCCIIYLAK